MGGEEEASGTGESDQSLEQLDRSLGQRHLVVTVHDQSGQIELDPGGLAPWEIVGVAGWLELVAHEELSNSMGFFTEDSEDGDDEEETP